MANETNQSVPELCRLCLTAITQAAPNLLLLLDNLQFGFYIFGTSPKWPLKTFEDLEELRRL